MRQWWAEQHNFVHVMCGRPTLGGKGKSFRCKARKRFLTSKGHISQMQPKKEVRLMIKWSDFRAGMLRLWALNIRILELLRLSKCHIYSGQPQQEYPSCLWGWVSGQHSPGCSASELRSQVGGVLAWVVLKPTGTCGRPTSWQSEMFEDQAQALGGWPIM